MNSSAESTGGGNSLGAGRAVVRGHRPIRPFLALIASVSLGRILFRSPTIPRSENSKIGALASLLIATMFSEDCMPTLCWIAPEMPAARYSFGATVLPVWPICAAYGYQPASTTARVAATAVLPPNALASVLGQLEALGLAESAAAGDEDVGALDVDVGAALLAALDHRGLVDHGEYSTSTSTTSAEPPSPCWTSNALIRPMMIPRSPL